MVMCLIVTNNLFATEHYSDLLNRLNDFEKQTAEEQKVMLDNSLRKSIYGYLLENRKVSLKDFQRIRVAYYVSDIIFRELSAKYSATTNNYQEAIKNNTDKIIYEITMDIQKRYNFRDFHLCRGDETKAMESFNKVKAIRKNRRTPQNTHLEEWINSYNEILEECRYETGAIYALLDIYRGSKNREKYNDLMLRILKEDQVDYDYLYYPISTINTNLIIQYLFFFTHINTLKEKLILTKEQVKFIAEDMLTKHKELLDFKNEYYVRRDNSVDEYHMRDAVNALICVSTWLRKYKMDSLNNKLLERYFYNELVLDTMRNDPQYNDFNDYLQGWKKSRENAAKETKDPKTK